MRILFVFNHPAPYKVNLLNGLSKFHDLDVIFERKGNSNRPQNFYYQKENKFLFRHIFCRGINIGEENHFSFRVRNYIKKNHAKYDLIIMNGYSTISEVLAIKYMIKNKIPYSLYVNGGKIRYGESKFKYNLKCKLISNAENYFSPCRETNDYLIYYGADSTKIHNYVYSTVYAREILSKPLLSNEVVELRKENNLHINSFINFVSFGQFISRKNNMFLLRIFTYLPSYYHLTLIGDGKEKNMYQKYIKENHLEKRISLLSFKTQTELLPFLRNFDYFISLSKEDIYGHMINEALSQGLPVVASRSIVAANHLIKEGQNGCLVGCKDIECINSAIKKVQTINKNHCLDTAKNNTIEKMVESHLEIFKELRS